MAAIASLLGASQVWAYGEPDPNFSLRPIEGGSCGTGLTVLPDDGAFVPVVDVARSSADIAKFHADGTLDTRWSGDGIAPLAQLFTANTISSPILLPLPNSGLIAAGWHLASAGRVDQLQRLNPDGSNDETYGHGGLSNELPGLVATMALTPDGSVIVEGTGNQPTFQTPYLARVTSQGLLDQSFGQGGVIKIPDIIDGDLAHIYAWSVLADGSVEVGMVRQHFATPQTARQLILEVRRFPGNTVVSGRIVPNDGIASWLGPLMKVDATGGIVIATSGVVDVTLAGTNISGRAAVIYLTRFDGTASVATIGSLGSINLPNDFAVAPQSTALPIELWQTPGGRWTVLADITHFYSQLPAPIYVSTERHAVRFLANGQADPQFQQGVVVPATTKLSGGGLVGTTMVNGKACALARYLSDEQRVEANVIEYYHPASNHYFMTVDSFEAGSIDANAAANGWVRTGRTFGAWLPVDQVGATPVCRFVGPVEHFFTPQGFECDLLKRIEADTPAGQPAWHYEGIAFSETASADGTCPPNLQPIYRAYNGPADRGEGPSHRYTTDLALYNELLAKGWLGEGVHFCAPPRTVR